MVQVLRMGSRGPEVTRLQNALNTKLNPSPRLVPDGQFGGNTDRAVRRFQQDAWLIVDGIAGQCTQNAAFDTETYPAILHRIPLQPQPTPTTCWAASTAMMINSTPMAVVARTPADMIAPDGGLRNWSATDQALPRGQAYGAVHGLRCNAPQSYMVSAIRDKLRRGPLMFDMLWDTARYLRPNPSVPGTFMGSPGHMICVIGIRGDDDPTGRGTTLRINDPWAPNIGATYSVGYYKWMQEVPTRTYRVFER